MTVKKHKQDGTEQEGTQASEAGVNEAEIARMRAELEELSKTSAEYKDALLRERADFVNYKKRIERDQQQSLQDTTGRIAKKYLPVLDDLERAIKAKPQHGEGHAWAGGIELIYKKLQGILESEGVVEIKAEGEQFDPTRHEALTMETGTGVESGVIIEVIQKGYMIGERVIRAALVRVAQ